MQDKKQTNKLMYNGWSQINGKNSFLGLWVKCRTRPPTQPARPESRNVKSYAGLYINGYLVYML